MGAKYTLLALLPQVCVGFCLSGMLNNKAKLELFAASLHWG